MTHQRKPSDSRRSIGPIALALLLCVFGLMAIPASGQVLYGTLTGNVNDSSGAVIPNATVKAVNEATGFTREAHTNAEGVYSMADLQPGIYDISISAPSFGGFEQKGTAVIVNSVQRLNATLQQGQVSQEVTITDAIPLLQTDKADSNYTLSTQQIENLPTTSSTGRNFQSLYKLVPGATPPSEQNSAAGNPQRAQAVNINGVSNSTNTTRIDGAINAYPWLPYLIAYLPPSDGIESINVVTGSFNAEQGSAGGAAINVTIKSGTNNFHGSAWEYNSISQFNARNYFNTVAVQPIIPKNIYNEFGGSFGGPVWLPKLFNGRDKLFFFVDWNRVTIRKSTSGIQSVPTAPLRTGDFSAAIPAGTDCNATPVAGCIYDPATGNQTTGAGRTAFPGNKIPASRIAAATAQLYAITPLPNIAGLQLNNYFGSSTYAFNRDNIDTKITYNPNQTTSLFGHYSISPNTINDPQQFGAVGGGTWDGGQPGAATGRIQNIGIGTTHAFSPHLLLDANMGYTRQRLGAQSDDLKLGNYGTDVLKIPGTNNGADQLYGGIPAFTATGYGGLGNTNTGSPFLFRDNQYTGSANVTWVRATHSFRFGGEYVHQAINHFQPGSGTSTTPRGGFSFTGGLTSRAESGSPAQNNFNSVADFLLGLPQVFGKGVQIVNPLTLRISSFAFYAQDTWQATRNLTINYGVRYEYYPIVASDHFGVFRYDPSVRSTITDSFGTHTVGTTLVGGKAGIPNDTGIKNGWGMIVLRFGVSYRADDKTVIRTGFGITVDPDNLRNLLNAFPANVVLSQSGSNSHLNGGDLRTGISALPIPDLNTGYIPVPTSISTNAVPANFRRGYIESYNLSVQRQFPLSMAATVAYVGSHAIRQMSNVNINAAPINGGQAGRLLNSTYGPNTNNTDINALQPFRGSVYNGLQAQLTRSSSHLGSFGLVYTFSKAMDISDNSQSNGLFFAYPAYWDRNWALAGYDRKHNFQFWTVYPLPFGKGQPFVQSGPLSWVVGGWQLNTALSRVSGTPFTVITAGASLNAPGNSQVADQLVPHVKILGGHDSAHPYFDTTAFGSVSTARFGTGSRNSVRGPGIFNLDVGIKRTFPIYENLNFNFLAESFDVTNTAQFANPSQLTASTPAGFGVITSSNASRTIRLSGRITF